MTESTETPKGEEPKTPKGEEPKLVSLDAIRRRGALRVLLGLSLLLLAWSALQISGFEDHRVTDTFTVSAWAAVWLTGYIVCSWMAFGSPFLLATAYVLAMVAFHFGLIAQDGFGFIHNAGYGGEFGTWATLAGWYSNMALACIGSGFSIACLMFKPAAPMTRAAASALALRNLARLRNLGIGLCLACVVFLGLAIVQLGNFLAYDRVALFFSGAVDTRGIALLNWFGPSAATVMVISARTRSQKRWSNILGAIALLLFLASGNRSMALFPLLVGVVVWVKIGRRMPLLVAGSLALATLLAIPVIGTLRTFGAYDKLSFADVSKSSHEASVSLALAELGGSAGVLAITLQYVPAEDPYRFGSTYLDYLRQVIPNIGASKDSSEDPRAIIASSGSFSKGLARLSPARWASVKVLGPEAALYGSQGVGFSGIAEPYLNFGFLGVVVFFIGVGVLLARLECTNLALSLNWLLFSTTFYWFLIATVRNEFGVFTKPASFLLISLGVWVLIRRFTPYARA